MKGKSLLTLTGVGFAAYIAWSVFKKYILVQDLNFVPMSVDFANGGLVVRVAVQNPTSDTITMQSFSGNLIVDGSPVANVSTFTTTVIPANSSTPLQFNVQPNLIGLGTRALDIIQNGLSIAGVKLVGTANANNTPIPINITF